MLLLFYPLLHDCAGRDPGLLPEPVLCSQLVSGFPRGKNCSYVTDVGVKGFDDRGITIGEASAKLAADCCSSHTSRCPIYQEYPSLQAQSEHT